MKRNRCCVRRVLALMSIAVIGVLNCSLPTAYGSELEVDHQTVFLSSTLHGQLAVYAGGAAPGLYYTFDEGTTNSTIVDESGNLVTGTVNGTTWTNAGNIDGAYHFANGSGNYIDVDFGSDLELDGPFTLAAWVKAEVPTTPGAEGIIVKGANSSSHEYGIAVDSSGGSVYFASTMVTLFSSNNAIQTGVWYHVAGVLEGSGTDEAKIYIDGELRQTGTMNLPYSLSGGRPLYIGRWRDQYYYRGFIDDARIYARALSSTEVMMLYSNTASSSYGTSTVFQISGSSVAISGEASISHVVPHGDIEMGSYTNEP